jgi:2-polyprenyl-3-methyl-5-hydroxy-6-metoxy-1,4-benzoquinol methylase
MNTIDKFHNWRRKQRWNKQYKKGRWDNLKNGRERIRYQKIADNIGKHSKSASDILALGCGEGILLENLQDTDFNFFYGMDFSSVSIKKATNKKLKKSKFVCADIHTFTPESNYDVIVFNEAFYYIHETEKANVLKTVLSHLNENGILVISIYREGLGCWEYFDDNPQLQKLDFETVTTDEEQTYWKIGAYRKL